MLFVSGQNIWLALPPISALTLIMGVAMLWRPYYVSYLCGLQLIRS